VTLKYFLIFEYFLHKESWGIQDWVMTFLVNLKMTNASHEKTVKAVKILRDSRLDYDPIASYKFYDVRSKDVIILFE